MTKYLLATVAWAMLALTATLQADEAAAAGKSPANAADEKLAVGDQAPEFKIKDANGEEIDLAELTADGPVLVRLTCGCSGCDKELAYFQELHDAYEGKGLTSLAIFREPDAKVQAYVKEKKLKMLYAVDTKGQSWNVFKTKTMPTNFLIDKGGKIISIAAGCDPSGLLAKNVSDKVAELVGSDKVDVRQKVAAKQKAAPKSSKPAAEKNKPAPEKK
ncbi:MAG TPA: redoxin domain-containing protein [Pirellulales bacterium]|nr:redoxin domain-containing protein [Pirellulales bacterium]